MNRVNIKPPHMRILLIGDQSIQNDAVKSILNTEVSLEVLQMTHAQVQDGLSLTKKYFVSLIDLVSLSQNPVEYVRQINEKKLSNHIIALHSSSYDELQEALTDAGADYCFSIDSNPKDLVQLISQLNHK